MRQSGCRPVSRSFIEFIIINHPLYHNTDLPQSIMYQCTVKGGREGRDADAFELAQTCELLGAGEILLNCIDKDDTNSGFDLELIKHISEGVSIAVIASSGSGCVEHFSEVFETTNLEAALAAGIFHRKEVPISAVKEHIREEGIQSR